MEQRLDLAQDPRAMAERSDAELVAQDVVVELWQNVCTNATYERL